MKMYKTLYMYTCIVYVCMTVLYVCVCTCMYMWQQRLCSNGNVGDVDDDRDVNARRRYRGGHLYICRDAGRRRSGLWRLNTAVTMFELVVIGCALVAGWARTGVCWLYAGRW